MAVIAVKAEATAVIRAPLAEGTIRAGVLFGGIVRHNYQ